LSRDVELMRRRLRDELEAARQSREALALRSEVTVRLREVLEPSMSGADGPVHARGLLLPAEGVLAGDWFDVIALPSGAVATVVVDISGHGAVAGIFALQVKEHLLGALRLGLDPGAAFAFAAGQIGITEEQFATGVIVCLDPARGTCQWANAGHPAVLRARNGRVTQFGLTGPIVGPLDGAWETLSADCAAGDVLVLCTDGIIEARNGEGEELGMAALARIVQQHAADGPDELAERILSTAREHTAGVMADDATVLVCEVAVPA
jgi:serine phosphatase RsbU (regulator of sigma subunit)